MKSEYEIISHNNSNFHIFLVNLLYRTPHIHKDYEISLVVEGSFSLITPDGTSALSAGDIFVMNPFGSHELKADVPALILSLQVSPAFFTSYYPQMEQTEFDVSLLSCSLNPAICKHVRELLLDLARAYYGKEDCSSLKCASLINQLFFYLLSTQAHHPIPEKEKKSFLTKGTRMRNILCYIETHYTEKLLLSDIAGQEKLDLYYLSHFFKECFGVTFQDYVTKLRCERARQLLLLTDYPLLDISISCGFSDTKYFNKGFQKQYGCTPKEYRKNFQNARLEQQQKSMLTTQEFLSESASLITLEKAASPNFF
ncbi:MAG: AraC family transcriptional regulator [Lachnospiraceae bacterium]|nr:AraC family transcriptional regulator [Lachnospiraceae bacterium]